jgi:hypothetical protein
LDIALVRRYPFVFWAIDLHGVIFKPDYRADGNPEFYPGAVEVLQNISKNPYFKIIIYSSVQPEGYKRFKQALDDNNIVVSYFNENPECKDTKLSDFSRKFFFSILLEDKAGFEGDTDWFLVRDELKRLGKWM